MQRVRHLALVLLGTSALSFPALASQLPAQTDSAITAHAEAPAPRPAPLRYAQARGHMGGGLIEALFGEFEQIPRSRGPIYRHQPYGYPEVYPRYEIDHYSRHQRQARGEPAEATEMERRPVNPIYNRQMVEYEGKERPGTVIIDTPNRFLYLVQDGGRAVRYGIGVGRPGFTWAGVKTVSMKKEWPDWRPPDEMLKRRPDLPRYMPGGPDNPLGARALYLGSSLYRIHGSNEPWTIGTAVSSGCIRMRNEDVIDLYERVPVGARVIVI